MMTQKIIAQGAEAIISLKDNQIIKNRIKKSYRIPVLDERLRKRRTKSEAKIINKLKFITNVPKIISAEDNQIIMQYIEGKKLSEDLDDLENKNEIAEQIGKEIAKLHDNDIIHGDLTTSNMILVEDNDKNNFPSNTYKTSAAQDNLNNNSTISKKKSDFKIYFIDFGLGFHSRRIEDKAVDLHLIRQALEAKHFLHWKPLFEHIIESYNPKDKDKILEQLKKVESRGRYKNH